MDSVIQKNLDPLNLRLMDIDNFVKTRAVLEVTSPFIHTSSSNQMSEDGLFSEKIFGAIGTPTRFLQFGYISLNCKIIHPLIFQNIIALKRFYGDIMAGREYAIWDNEAKEFVRAVNADEPGADTGFAFFLRYFPQINWTKNASLKRDDKIDVLAKYANVSLITKFLVIPAGIRDMREDETRMEKDSINGLYLSLMTSCKAMPKGMSDDPIYDVIHYSVQKKVLAIYEYLLNMIEGKGGFLQGRLAHRSVVGACRDVITATSFECESPDSPQYHQCDETKVPLFLALKGFASLIVHQVMTMFYSNVITPESATSPMINPTTKKLEYVQLNPKDKDLFISAEGIQKTIDRFEDVDFRFRPVGAMCGKEFFYMYLVYDTGNQIYIFRNMEEFLSGHPGVDSKKIRPLTWSELFYIAAYIVTLNRCCLIVRYPISDEQNIFPSKHHIVTTSKGRVVSLVAEGPNDQDILLPEYPTEGYSWGDAIQVHNTKLRGLQGDFDGNCLLGETLVQIRTTRNWLENLRVLDYSKSKQDISKAIEEMLKNAFEQDGYLYTNTRLDSIPQAGDYTVDRNGARVYNVPAGCDVMSVKSNIACWAPFDKITVEDDCEYCTIKVGRYHTAKISTNESTAVFDPELGCLRKVTPEQAQGLWCPIIKASHEPFGKEGTIDDGWFIGAFVSDGYVSGSYVGYTKLDDATRNNFVRIVESKIPGCKHHVYHGNVRPGKLGESIAIHYTEKQVREYFDNLAKDTYASEPRNALTKTISDRLINNGTEEFLIGILSGLFDGDGSIIRTRNGYGFRLATSSIYLANATKRIARKLGIRACIATTPPRNWSKETYVVTFVLGDMIPYVPRLKVYRPSSRAILAELMNDSARMNSCGMNDQIPISRQEGHELADFATEIGKLNDAFSFRYIRRAIRWKLTEYLPFINPKSDLYYRVVNTDLYWGICQIVDGPAKATVYDLLVPDTKVFAVNDGLVVYDTVSYYGIQSDEANQEILAEFEKLPNYILPSGDPVAGFDDLTKITMRAMTEPVPGIDNQ